VCGEGGCGACSVVLSRQDGDNSREACLAVNSCLRPLASVHGWSVTTVEGLGSACKGACVPPRAVGAPLLTLV
jgi:xanthine dehydrogenase/oxidase